MTLAISCHLLGSAWGHRGQALPCWFWYQAEPFWWRAFAISLQLPIFSPETEFRDASLPSRYTGRVN